MDHRVEAMAALFADVGVTPQDLRLLLGTAFERILDDATEGCVWIGSEQGPRRSIRSTR